MWHLRLLEGLFFFLLLLLLPLQLVTVYAEKAYPLGCSNQDPSFYDYESKESCQTVFEKVPRFTHDDFLIVKRLGTGKFSDVFEAVRVDKHHNPLDQDNVVVLKCLKPVSERKIRREVLVLQRISQLPNMARLLGIVWPQSTIKPPPNGTQLQESNCTKTPNVTSVSVPRMPTLVLAHAGPHAQWLCHKQQQSSHDSTPLTCHEIRYYLGQLLVALDALHARGLMHRDVKPRNVLMDRRAQTLMLIDLGLADFYRLDQSYNVRVASRHYKSPELLLSYQDYDYAVDLWGVGCILAGLMFHKEPLFKGRDNLDQLGKIASRLGTLDLITYSNKFKMQLSSDVQAILTYYHDRGSVQRRPWTDLLSTTKLTEKEPLDPEFHSQGVDLLDKLLVYDHEQRWTARQAIQHAFFDTVREQMLSQVQEQ